MVEAWCFCCCQAHWSLPVGFLVLEYSVLCTVESISLFISFLYLDIYVLGDDAWISEGSSMQTKHLCVLIFIWTKGEFCAVKLVKHSDKLFLLTFPRQYFFCVNYFLCLSCFRFCSLLPSGHLHMLGKAWPFGSSLWCLIVFFNCVFSLPMCYPGSGVALDCIDSWS